MAKCHASVYDNNFGENSGVTCDRPLGHEGPHHDPELHIYWSEV